ncbi:hypothetical protein DFP72DRAFT_1054844 [Ephemerocybe angulata]|uniref:Ricin B lectin domain-containing protein n=1 Tax=Ephemerocybe angulata TaxID=980116 RepID=A0A8H6H732_9AGAR|nr:hypothetical protein DFP72DRAFT_1054844 [Tulosesus angulatus]
MKIYLALFPLVQLAMGQVPATQYILYNNCPTALPLFVAGDLVDTIPYRGNRTRFMSGNGSFYYFVKDPNQINTGLSIVPQNRPTTNGFCVPAICEDRNCPNAFTLPPNDQTFPPANPAMVAPPLPYYQCPFANTTYIVTILIVASQVLPQRQLGDEFLTHYNVTVTTRISGWKGQYSAKTIIYQTRWALNTDLPALKVDGYQYWVDRDAKPDVVKWARRPGHPKHSAGTTTAMRTSFTLLTLATAVLAISTAQALEKRQTPYASQFVIHNSCPSAINLYIGGQLDSRIPTGGSVTKFSAPGFFYTDANGGNANGAGTLRAGFYDNGYYYMVRDGEGPLNTGMTITPNQRPSPGGMCQSISCNTDNCTTPFSQPPTAFPPVPYRKHDIRHQLLLVWLVARPLVMPHPTFDHIEKCIDVQGGILANGTPVQLYDCNGTPAQNWLLDRGSTKIQLLVGWHLSFSIGQCLDLPNGDLSNSNKNENQVWKL